MRCSLFAIVVATLFGCGSDDPPPPPPPPPQNALFDPLAAPTPNTLRGVWVLASTSGSAAELRLRFSEGALLAGTKCTYSQPGYAPLIAGQGTNAEIEGLDAAKGKFTPGADLSFTAKPDARLCQGVFAKDAYEFTIKDTAMTLTVATKTGTLVFNKVGD